MFAAALLAVLAAMGLVLARALLGPTIYDRILALNSFGTKTVLLIALYGFLTGRPDCPALSHDQGAAADRVANIPPPGREPELDGNGHSGQGLFPDAVS